MRQVPGQLTVIRMGMKETGDENGAAGPTAASSFNDGVFCYELKIPIADIGGKIAGASPAKKRLVAIGVQIGGMTEAEMETMQAEMKEKMVVWAEWEAAAAAAEWAVMAETCVIEWTLKSSGCPSPCRRTTEGNNAMKSRNSERTDLESRIVAQAALLFLAVFSLVVLAASTG